MRTKSRSIFNRLFCAAGAAAVSIQVWAVPSGASTYDLESLFDVPEPQGSVRFLPPGAQSGIDERHSAAVVAAMEAFAQDRFDEMEAIATRLTTTAPESGEGWYLLGLALANSERFEEALDALTKAADRFELNTQPLVMKGEILEHLNRPADAVTAYKAATERDPGLFQLQEKIAIFAEAEGDMTHARDRWALSIAHAPGDRLFPRARLAKLYLRTGKPEEAVAVVSDFQDRNGDDLEALATLGVVQQEAGDFDAAAATFESLQEQLPEDPLAALYLARSFVAGGRLEGAIEVLTAASERIPENATLHGELGRVLGARRDYAQALAAYERALAIEPDNSEYLRGASIASLRLNDLDRALENAKRLVELRPDDAGASILLATAQERSGRDSDAISTYESVVSKNPENWIALNNLAVLLLEAEPERALELSEKAVRLSDGQVDTRMSLGRAYLAADQAEDAVEIFAALSANNENDAMLAFRHGQALIWAGQTEAGERRISDALQIDANFAAAKEARGLLGH